MNSEWNQDYGGQTCEFAMGETLFTVPKQYLLLPRAQSNAKRGDVAG